MSTGFSIPTNTFLSANTFVPAGLILSPYTSLPIIQDMPKPFFIRKPITGADNITARMYAVDLIGQYCRC